MSVNTPPPRVPEKALKTVLRGGRELWVHGGRGHSVEPEGLLGPSPPSTLVS